MTPLLCCLRRNFAFPIVAAAAGLETTQRELCRLPVFRSFLAHRSAGRQASPSLSLTRFITELLFSLLLTATFIIFHTVPALLSPLISTISVDNSSSRIFAFARLLSPLRTPFGRSHYRSLARENSHCFSFFYVVFVCEMILFSAA